MSLLIYILSQQLLLSLTIMPCIFRLAKRNGVACNAHSVYDTAFCDSHRRCVGDAFLYDVAMFMGPFEVVDATNIYQCLDNLWTAKKSTTTSLADAFLGVDIITFLLNHPDINKIGEAVGIDVRRQKMGAAFDIVSFFWNIWSMGQNQRHLAAVRALQRAWRRHKAQPLQGVWPNVAAKNDACPFTLEPITKLPRNSVFSFFERGAGSWNLYAFCGKSLYDYSYVHKQYTNPLTRAELGYATIRRLRDWHRAMYGAHEVIVIDDDDEQEDVALHSAFTSIASRLELEHNVYIQPEWLLGLSEFDVIGVFTEFHQHEGASTNAYMDRNAEERAYVANDAVPSQIVLAKEITRMLCNEPAPSVHVYNLVTCLASYIPALDSSLPDWVYDAANV